MAEYVLATWPAARVVLQQRLGSPPKELIAEVGEAEAAQRIKPWLRWADALVILQDELVLIEGKIRADPATVGQLTYYASLVPKTPELAAHHAKRLRKLIVAPWHDRDLEEFAKANGVEVAFYRPAWVEEYIAHRQQIKPKP